MADIPPEAAKFKPPTREKVRRAIARVIECEETRASTKAISVAKLRGAGCGDQNAATELLRLWRAGKLSVADPWDDAPAPPAPAGAAPGGGGDPLAQLGERVRAARSDGGREAVALELGGLVADRKLDLDSAQTIRGLLSDARASAEKKRAVEPIQEDPKRMCMAGEEAYALVYAYEGIISAGRREAILAFAQQQLEADLTENPTEDLGTA